MNEAVVMYAFNKHSGTREFVGLECQSGAPGSLQSLSLKMIEGRGTERVRGVAEAEMVAPLEPGNRRRLCL